MADLPITLHFKDSDFRELDQVFNRTKTTNRFLPEANLFPKHLVEDIIEIHLKAWFIKKTFNMIHAELNNGSFVKERLEKNRKEYNEDVFEILNKDKRGYSYILVFENKMLFLYAELFFFELKSYLDILSRLIGKYLGVKNTHITFGKDNNQAGGEFLNILRHNVPNEQKILAKQFITIIQTYKPIWIDSSVRFRDTITHYRTFQTKVAFASEHLHPPFDEFKMSTWMDNNKIQDIINPILKGFEEFNKEIIDIIKLDTV
jgi:hypothetical protein